jgi:hypothetical protein
MFITEKPEGQAPTRYEFDAKRISMSRAAMLESRFKKLSGEDQVTLELMRMSAIQGGAAAQRVILWHCKNVLHPVLKIEDVDPLMGEVEVKPSAGEIEELRAAVANNTGLNDAQRELILASLDTLAGEPEESDEGKAPSSDSETSTG